MGVAYGSDAVSAEGIHHVLRVFVSEEDLGDVDAEQVVVALLQRQFDGVAEALGEARAGAAQLADVQKHGICWRHQQLFNCPRLCYHHSIQCRSIELGTREIEGGRRRRRGTNLIDVEERDRRLEVACTVHREGLANRDRNALPSRGVRPGPRVARCAVARTARIPAHHFQTCLFIYSIIYSFIHAFCTCLFARFFLLWVDFFGGFFSFSLCFNYLTFTSFLNYSFPCWVDK